MKKKLLCYMIIFSIIYFSFPIFGQAKTVGDLMNELNALEAKENQNKQDKALTQSEITKANQNIDHINETVTKAKEDIEKLSVEIENLNKEIENKDE